MPYQNVQQFFCSLFVSPPTNLSLLRLKLIGKPVKLDRYLVTVFQILEFLVKIIAIKPKTSCLTIQNGRLVNPFFSLHKFKNRISNRKPLDFTVFYEIHAWN
jgi:hypothetical protein